MSDGSSLEGRKPGLLQSSLVVSSMTMLSRVLGLVRDIVIATWFGAAANTDAFFVAFKIPNFLRRLFAEGAFSQAFVPVLSEYRATRADQVKGLIDAVCGVLGATLLAVTTLAVVAAPVVTAIFAPGFVGIDEKYQLASDMIRLTFPYLFLISMTGFAGAVLNSYSRFAVPAFTPVLLNLCLIGGAILVSPRFEEPVFALAWAVLVAGIAQLLFQLPFVGKLGLLPRPRVDLKHEGVKRILVLMVPALFGVSVSQINLLLDTVLASFLPTGSISWLYYSDRLSELPLGVFAIAISTVILPSLSRQHAEKSSTDFIAMLDWSIRAVLAIALPATLALVMLAEPILVTLFQYGALSSSDISMSTLSLRAYALGLPAFMLIKVLASGYYARQDMRTPVSIGIKAMVANMVLNLVLVLPLYKYFGIGHVGLALATSLAAWLNALLLLRGLPRAGISVLPASTRTDYTKILASVAALATGLFLASPWLANLDAAGALTRGLTLVPICLIGALFYLALLILLKPRLITQRPRLAVDTGS